MQSPRPKVTAEADEEDVQVAESEADVQALEAQTCRRPSKSSPQDSEGR